MVWVMVVVAIAVLGAAAWAGTGRLGEMPGPVNDRPKAHIPEGPVDELFLEGLSLPLVGTGYRPGQVEDRLAAHVAGESQDHRERFDVVRRGYDMQAVDTVLDRLRGEPAQASVMAYAGPVQEAGIGGNPCPEDEDCAPEESAGRATRGDPPAGELRHTE